MRTFAASRTMRRVTLGAARPGLGAGDRYSSPAPAPSGAPPVPGYRQSSAAKGVRTSPSTSPVADVTPTATEPAGTVVARAANAW